MMADLQTIINTLFSLDKILESSQFLGELVLWLFQFVLLSLSTAVLVEVTF